MTPRRKFIRLKNYNYSTPAYYFVTVCVQNKQPLFGTIENGIMQLNDAGKMIEKWWHKMFEKYDEINMDEYIVMPNHIHGTIQTVGAIPCNRPHCENRPDQMGEIRHDRGENEVSPLHNNYIIPNHYTGLGQYISWFKRMSTNEYIRNVKTSGWPPFNKRIWQRNYYDHIIRDERSLRDIRKYIQNNPAQWNLEKYTP